MGITNTNRRHNERITNEQPVVTSNRITQSCKRIMLMLI